MIRHLSFAAVPILLSACVLARANAESGGSERRTITVNASSEIRATPNLALVSFAVVTEGKKAADAAAENAKQSTAVSEALKNAVAGNGKVTSAGYSVQPKYAYDSPAGGPRSAPRIEGYTVNNQITVETSNISTVGSLIDRGLAGGANQVNSVSFTLSERSAPLREALAKAGAEAKAQAESIAQALSVRLKGVIAASTQGGVRPQPRVYEMKMVRAQMADAAASTPIDAGDVTVSAELTVTYEIE